jgi:hypothetical protein
MLEGSPIIPLGSKNAKKNPKKKRLKEDRRDSQAIDRYIIQTPPKHSFLLILIPSARTIHEEQVKFVLWESENRFWCLIQRDGGVFVNTAGFTLRASAMAVGSWHRTDTCHDTCRGVAQTIRIISLFYFLSWEVLADAKGKCRFSSVVYARLTIIKFAPWPTSYIQNSQGITKGDVSFHFQSSWMYSWTNLQICSDKFSVCAHFHPVEWVKNLAGTGTPPPQQEFILMCCLWINSICCANLIMIQNANHSNISGLIYKEHLKDVFSESASTSFRTHAMMYGWLPWVYRTGTRTITRYLGWVKLSC